MWELTNEEFTGLMQQYQKLIYTVCLQFVHEPHTAEDLTQDTFLSAFSAIDRCEPQYYKQWLVRVAANKCKDHLKSAWVRKVDAPGDDALPEPRGAPGSDADCILYAALQGPYADAETFAADCMAVMQRAADAGLGFTCYHFSADEDIADGISYYLDCVASYPAGLTAAQVAQRVQASYCYDNNSFSSEADRDDYIRRQLQNEISDEYADRHDGAYPDEKYLNEETERRLAERTGMATHESAQA